jgi:hypothetical protein
MTRVIAASILGAVSGLALGLVFVVMVGAVAASLAASLLASALVGRSRFVPASELRVRCRAQTATVRMLLHQLPAACCCQACGWLSNN